MKLKILALTKTIIRKIINKIKFFFVEPIDIKSSWINEPKKFTDLVKFMNWFDSTSSLEETREKSKEDWEKRITNFKQYTLLRKNIGLEIGFGGGRLIAQACKDFKHVLGVDIHSSFRKTEEYLNFEGVKNYKLLKKNGLSHIKDKSIDFIFSFIVFQHFDSFKEVNFYLREIKRLLNPKGYCQIFFGKSNSRGVKVINQTDFNKRHCSLFIEPKYFREYLVNNFNFEIISYEDKMKKRLNEDLNTNNESGQARVLFRLKKTK